LLGLLLCGWCQLCDEWIGSSIDILLLDVCGVLGVLSASKGIGVLYEYEADRCVLPGSLILQVDIVEAVNVLGGDVAIFARVACSGVDCDTSTCCCCEGVDGDHCPIVGLDLARTNGGVVVTLVEEMDLGDDNLSLSIGGIVVFCAGCGHCLGLWRRGVGDGMCLDLICTWGPSYQTDGICVRNAFTQGDDGDYCCVCWKEIKESRAADE